MAVADRACTPFPVPTARRLRSQLPSKLAISLHDFPTYQRWFPSGPRLAEKHHRLSAWCLLCRRVDEPDARVRTTARLPRRLSFRRAIEFSGGLRGSIDTYRSHLPMDVSFLKVSFENAVRYVNICAARASSSSVRVCLCNIRV